MLCSLTDARALELLSALRRIFGDETRPEPGRTAPTGRNVSANWGRWRMTSYLPSLAGGALIGLSASWLLLMNGRIAGISGIAAGFLGMPFGEMAWRAAFVVGLLLGPFLFRLASGHWPEVTLEASWAASMAGGFLVGFGTRLGSGCTSGHGVCGLARLSPRSLAAVAVFMATAIVTVFLARHGGLR